MHYVFSIIVGLLAIIASAFLMSLIGKIFSPVKDQNIFYNVVFGLAVVIAAASVLFGAYTIGSFIIGS